jgi:hypothetical protein
MANLAYDEGFKLVVQPVNGKLMAYVYAGDSETPVASKEVVTATQGKNFFYEVLTTTDNDYDVTTELLVAVATRVEYGDE